MASVNDRLPEPHLGLIGGFDASDASALGPVVAEALDWLLAQGCRAARGPILRHTWYPFRLVTEGFDTLPPLRGEPWNAPWLSGALADLGFVPMAWYVSTVTSELDTFLARARGHADRTRAAGYTLRPLDPSRDLPTVYAITLRAFAHPDNMLFHPIEPDELRLVTGEPDRLAADFVSLAYAPDGEPVGFCFVAREGPELASLKTLAVVPEHRRSGVGMALAHAAHAACRDAGIRRMVHALLRVDGPTTRMSARGDGPVFRRYALVERALR